MIPERAGQHALAGAVHLEMNTIALKTEATLHRTRLLLGLTQGTAVVAWADARLIELSNVPDALLEVSLTPPEDLSALRHALLPLADEHASATVLESVRRDVATDLQAGRRGVKATASILRQMRSMLPLPKLMDATLDSLTDGLMLAEAGIGVTIEDAEQAVVTWARASVDAPHDPTPRTQDRLRLDTTQ